MQSSAIIINICALLTGVVSKQDGIEDTSTVNDEPDDDNEMSNDDNE